MASMTSRRCTFHPDAYKFVFHALQFTQERLDRPMAEDDLENELAHISGPELLEGCRLLALEQYGLLARTVFETWNVRSTADFGRIVFDLIDKGEMKKTDDDCEEDFANVYDFADALESQYEIDLSGAFR